MSDRHLILRCQMQIHFSSVPNLLTQLLQQSRSCQLHSSIFKIKTLALSLTSLVHFQLISKFCWLCIQKLLSILLLLTSSTTAIPGFIPRFFYHLPKRTSFFYPCISVILNTSLEHCFLNTGKTCYTLAQNPEKDL